MPERWLGPIREVSFESAARRHLTSRSHLKSSKHITAMAILPSDHPLVWIDCEVRIHEPSKASAKELDS